MPGLDLCAARICRKRRALLFEKGNKAAAAQAGIYLGRGEVTLTKSLAQGCAPRAAIVSNARPEASVRRRTSRRRVQCTAVKNRATRKPDSQVHTGWLRIPRS